MKTLRIRILLFVAAFLLLPPIHVPGQTLSPLVVQLTLKDTVQPVSAQYLHRGLLAAASQHASLVIITLDTPGGLLTSTREMVADIEASPVPVAVFVAPTGARAGSAGFFLLEAADIAAMAPATNAGASHPIIPGRTLDPILKLKIENDAAAFLRSFVLRRGRNPEAADDAVRNSKSYSDAECLNLHLIDFTAHDERDLMRQIDAKPFHRFDGSTQVLHLAGATRRLIDPSLREQLLTRLTNPDLAVLLLLCGILLIYTEFNIPGTIIPGSLGALLVMLALFGLNLLPIHHAAVAIVLAGFALMLLELKIPSHGILALFGISALVFGLATLVDAPIDALRVHLATAIAVGVGFGSISLLLAWVALAARRNKVLLGPHAMVGKTAVALTALAPGGQVQVRGEIWQAALTECTSVPQGTALVVRAVDGLALLVSPLILSPTIVSPVVASTTSS